MKYLLTILLITATFAAYNPKNGLDLAYFSKIAYDPIANINAWNCGSCSRFKMTDVKAFINSTWNMQGYVGYSPALAAIIVAFRGSADAKNWIDDFDAAHVTYPSCSGCTAHKGFYTGYATLSATVKAQITTVASKYRNAPIYITGHSLGGALAVVAALDIHRTFGNAVKLYTYGQPRVGNTAFANYASSQIADSFRVIHYADIVPHVPPLAMDYRHHNHEVWYQEDMRSFKVCNAEDSSCADSISPTKMSTADHDMSHYIKIVGAVNKKEQLRKVFESALELISLI